MGSNAFMLRDELIAGLGTLLPKRLSSAVLKAFLVVMVSFRYLHKEDGQHERLNKCSHLSGQEAKGFVRVQNKKHMGLRISMELSLAEYRVLM